MTTSLEWAAWAERSASQRGKEPEPSDLVESEVLCCGVRMVHNPKRIGGWTFKCLRCKAMQGCDDDVLP
jgi:hypothetical protein